VLDHWPFINGKAIIDGIKFTDLDMSDMLDVMHYYFEVDHFMASAEEAESKSNVRVAVYRNLYDKDYKYAYKSNSSTSGYNYSTTTASGQPVMDGFVGQDVDDRPDKGPTKPFVPATDFNPDSPTPFGGVLDPPIG
jgi:hypothetical protein